MKKVEITIVNDWAEVESSCHGQDLYVAYVAFTAHVMEHMNNPCDIHVLCETAQNDAKKLLERK